MKKIKLSVAALLIAGMSYGQCVHSYSDSISANNHKESIEQFKTVEFMVADVIDAIRMDMFYGHLERERGEYYINMILKVKSINRDIMAGIFKDNQTK